MEIKPVFANSIHPKKTKKCRDVLNITFLRFVITMKRNIYIYVLTALFALPFIGCRKTVFYNGAEAYLRFSTNTVFFDTVFTSLTTTTKQLKVYNPYKQTVKTSIRLYNGSSSYYSLNIDGSATNQLDDVEIAGGDSIFIFIRVNIPPNGANNPLVVTDTIFFHTNNTKQRVVLEAAGQDVHFILPDATYFGLPCKIVAHENEHITWRNDKPYVIYGYAVVDSSAQLDIEEGTRVYIHKNGGMLCYRGSCLHVNGSKDKPVLFGGDRTDHWSMQDYALWDRIWLMESNKDHVINYAQISNAYIGIQAETIESAMGNKLILTNTIIKQNALFGLHTRAYNLVAENNIITDCAVYGVYLSAGGNCQLNNNTIYNLYESSRTTPTVLISNYYKYATEQSTSVIYGDMVAELNNNIISGTGGVSNEILIDSVQQSLFDIQFNNCLLKASADNLNKLNHKNTLTNIDPLFNNATRNVWDFSLSSTSPCKRAGKYLPSPSHDIFGTLRNNPPSVGAAE